MRRISSEAEVGRFLEEFWGHLGDRENPSFDLWEADKNDRFQAESGFSKADVGRVIYGLRVRNYSWGPEADDNQRRPVGDVWLFWAEYEGYELYVKLKLERAGNSATPAICMSCHEPEYPIERPYWTRGR